ncbi:hypothetical protein MKY20_20545 [Cytobacillus sp. FSL W8-0315]|uniref:hypothetical protein n=1 Tax=Cytobacillus sp. FSL W8-0315 TaxID=2921600 RepID=UPI0030F8167E
MTITIRERKELRIQLLFNLYEYYYQNNGVSKKLTRENLQENKEVDLAYQYLENKNLIHVDRQGSQLFIKPTVSGIDFVEENHPDRNKVKTNNESQEPDNTAQALLDWL